MALIWRYARTMRSIFQFAFVLGLHSVAATAVPPPAEPLTPVYPPHLSRQPCSDVSPQSPLLASLRMTLMSKHIYGYIFLDQDPHKDENIHEDDRHAFRVSGYASEYGNIVLVTLTSQAIFVRNKTDAQRFLDCSWQVEGLYNNDIIRWTVNNNPFGVRIGADARIVGTNLWTKMEAKFNASGITLVDLADILPSDNRDSGQNVFGTNSTNTDEGKYDIYVHDIQYSGNDWTNKMAELLQGMTLDESDALVSTAVDDIAWLFNLRGRYYQHSPLFPAFAMIVPEFKDIGRHLHIILYLKNTNLSPDVRQHLKLDDCVQCVQIKDYDKIYDDLSQVNEDSSMRNVLVDQAARHAVVKRINPIKIRIVHTPIALMKVVKNEVEIRNMKQACLRDAAYVAHTMTQIEKTVANHEYIDEFQATQLLDTYRENDELNRGLAYATVSAYGPNGAIAHYFVHNDTASQLTDDSLYVLDSGGQYLDGTVDGTRTFHFGEPTRQQKDVYTRVLMALIDVFSLTWVARQGYPGYLTLLARRPLWDLGLDFNHGSGHGVGQFMNVHEEPINFLRRWPGTRDGLERYVFQPGVVQAIEPGAYVKGRFGVRLETMGVVTTVEDNRQTRDPTPFPDGVKLPRLHFEPMYFLPFESKLIQYNLLTNRQIYWLNSYHAQCRSKLGDELKRRGYTEAYEWLKDRTEMVGYNSGFSSYKDSGATMARCRLIPLVVAVCTIVKMFMGV